MASLSSVYLKKETLEVLLKTLEKKGQSGIEITVSINDETKVFQNQNGNDTLQNVSAWVSQSKEDRENGKEKYYVGNGKCFWTNGDISIASAEEEPTPKKNKKASASEEEDDDLPF